MVDWLEIIQLLQITSTVARAFPLSILIPILKLVLDAAGKVVMNSVCSTWLLTAAPLQIVVCM